MERIDVVFNGTKKSYKIGDFYFKMTEVMWSSIGTRNVYAKMVYGIYGDEIGVQIYTYVGTKTVFRRVYFKNGEIDLNELFAKALELQRIYEEYEHEKEEEMKRQAERTKRLERIRKETGKIKGVGVYYENHYSDKFAVTVKGLDEEKLKKVLEELKKVLEKG